MSYYSEPTADSEYLIYKVGNFYYGKPSLQTGLQPVPGNSGAETVIQACINNLTGLAPKHRYGVIRLTSEIFITYSGITTFPGVAILGPGPVSAFSGIGTAALQPVSGSNFSVITIVVDPNNTGNTVFPYLANFTINGANVTAPNQHGIDIQDTNGMINDIYIDHVGVFQVGGNGFNISNGGKHFLRGIYSENNKTDGVRAAKFSALNIGEASYIHGNQIGVNTHVTPVGNWLQISNSRIDGTSIHALALKPSANTIINGNIFSNNGNNSGAAVQIDTINSTNASMEFFGNAFYDDRASGAKASFAFDFSVGAITKNVDIHNNSMISSNFQSGLVNNGVATNTGLILRNNPGFNPVGLILLPIDSTNSLIGLAGGGTQVSGITSGTTYTAYGIDSEVYFTSGNSITKNGTVLNVGPTGKIDLSVGDTAVFSSGILIQVFGK